MLIRTAILVKGMVIVAGMVKGAIGSVHNVVLFALVIPKETRMTEAIRTVVDGIFFGLVLLRSLDTILLRLFLLSIVI